MPTTVVVAICTGAAAMLRPDLTLLLTGLAGGLFTWIGFRILHALSNGGLGCGDVRYAALVGLTSGAMSLTAAWWAIAIASLAAAAWALTTRRKRQLAYGPRLALG